MPKNSLVNECIYMQAVVNVFISINLLLYELTIKILMLRQLKTSSK